MKIAVVANAGVAKDLKSFLETDGSAATAYASLSDVNPVLFQVVFAQWPRGSQLGPFLDALRRLASRENPVPVIVLVELGSVAERVRAFEEGAYDVLTLPPDPLDLRAEVAHIRGDAQEVDLTERKRFAEVRQNLLVGENKVFVKCLDDVRKAGRSDVNVLLVGETGTGKELVANAIHCLSRRRGEPYTAVNVAALSETVIESELFGHEKGAFTGADRAHDGIFARSGRGVLLLDEIGDFPLNLQIKLLRVIEQRTFSRVGGSQLLPFEARLICATSKRLQQAVNNGEFRRDLLSRIDEYRISLPPLRDRQSDIPILVHYFLRRHAEGRVRHISQAALTILTSFSYPMNVRQLRNAVVSAIPKVFPGDTILPKHLPAEILRPSFDGVEDNFNISVPKRLQYRDARQFAAVAVDKMYLPPLMQRLGHNRSKVASALDIDRKTLSVRLRAVDND